MAVQNLDLVISVLDKYSKELDKLLLKLEEVAVAAEQVDNITIDVDVRGKRKLDTLMAKMAALGMMEMNDVNVNVRTLGSTVGGGDAGRGIVPGVRMPEVANLSKAAGSAVDNVDEFNLSMSDLHNLLAKAVPILLVFIGAIPALIGALVALAAAAIAAAAGLAALAGFGALGLAMARSPDDIMGGFEEILGEIQGDFLDAFSGLAERLTGFSERALDGLDRLFENIASKGDVLVDFTKTASDFGQWLQTFLPSLLADMGKMARAFGPFFGRIMDEFDFSVLGALTQFMADMAGETIQFIRLLIEFTPLIAKMSIGFLQVVNAIGLAVQAFAAIMSILPVSEQAWGALVATILTAISVVLLARAANLALAWSYLAKVVPALATTITTLGGYIATALTTVGVNATLAKSIGVVAASLGLLVGILWVVGAIAGSFTMLESDITSATKALEDFNSVGSELGRNPYADPDLRHGSVTSGRGRPASLGGSSRGTMVVNIEGNADEDMVREQTGNALYRMERKGRGF